MLSDFVCGNICLSFLGRKLKHEECLSFQVDCLIRLKRWDKAVEILEELVQKTPDQWTHIQQYINCQIMRCCEMRKKEEELAAMASEKALQAECREGKEEEGYGVISPPEEDDSSLGAKCNGEGKCGDDASSYSWTSLM